MGRQGTRGIDPDIMVKRDEISAQYVVDFLNELVRLDKYALTDMMSERIVVNRELRNHPTIRTSWTGVLLPQEDRLPPEVGLLAIINGMFGLEGETQAIEVIMDKHTDVITEFRLTEPWKGWTGPQAV